MTLFSFHIGCLAPRLHHSVFSYWDHLDRGSKHYVARANENIKFQAVLESFLLLDSCDYSNTWSCWRLLRPQIYGVEFQMHFDSNIHNDERQCKIFSLHRSWSVDSTCPHETCIDQVNAHRIIDSIKSMYRLKMATGDVFWMRGWFKKFHLSQIRK